MGKTKEEPMHPVLKLTDEQIATAPMRQLRQWETELNDMSRDTVEVVAKVTEMVGIRAGQMQARRNARANAMPGVDRSTNRRTQPGMELPATATVQRRGRGWVAKCSRCGAVTTQAREKISAAVADHREHAYAWGCLVVAVRREPAMPGVRRPGSRFDYRPVLGAAKVVEPAVAMVALKQEEGEA